MFYVHVLLATQQRSTVCHSVPS